MSYPSDASTTHVRLGGIGLPPVGSINFVAQGNPGDPAKFCIVPKEYPVNDFAQEFFENACGLTRPKVLISVTGGAQDFVMLSSKLEQIFSRGLLRAAQNTKAWIVTGGLDSGVMEFVGDAVREQDADVPCIGIATYSKVTHKDHMVAGTVVNYSPEKKNDAASAALNPDHTHFVLVDSKVDQWGEEIQFRTALEDYISREWHVPLVLVAINGGPGTLQTVVEGARKKFPIIIVEGSGRASDAMASYLKHAADPTRYNLIEWESFLAGVKPAQHQGFIAFMQELHKARKYITIFNPNENATEDMDKAILRSILKTHADSGFRQKLGLGVQWGRADLIEELLQQDDAQMPAQEKVEAINYALQKSLKLNKPEIYELLIHKGADKGSVNLHKLYNLAEIKYQIDRLIPFAGLSSIRDQREKRVSEKTPLKNGSLNKSEGVDFIDGNGLDIAKQILNSISPMYATLLVDNKVTFTDVLVWAILVERPELAQAIWRQTVLPVHSALVACHLYASLGEWFQGEEVFTQHKQWFEAEAINVLAEVEYENAVEILEWKWKELNSTDALQMSELAECKDFYATAYVQRYLDEKLYSDDAGRIPPGTRMWRVLIMVFFPFLIPTGSYTYLSDDTRFFSFYSLPVVKFITSTLCYIIFLGLLTTNLIGCIPGRYDIRWYEVLLWVWIFASLVEEVVQYFEDSDGYFELLSNQMDLIMYLCLVAYFVLRILAWFMESPQLVEAFTDVLIISTIACYIRLMNVFAFSKSLGPLFFVIKRLFTDVWQWLFIFFVFMMSFQFGIFAVTRQADQNPWTTYPHGSLGVGFSTIIGDTGDNTMEWMGQTHIGVVLMSCYALICQVMLVNLLIAMMGDTYSAVKENSDKEWKFYRYSLVVDYIAGSPYPPPLNLVFGPLFALKRRIKTTSTKARLDALQLKGFNVLSFSQGDDRGDLTTLKTILKMKLAKEKVLEREEAQDLDTLHTVSGAVREHMRLLNTQRDSDRVYLEYNMKNILTALAALQAQVEAIANRQNHLPPPTQKVETQ